VLCLREVSLIYEVQLCYFVTEHHRKELPMDIKTAVNGILNTSSGGLSDYPSLWIARGLKEPVEGNYKNSRVTIDEFREEHDTAFHYNLWMDITSDAVIEDTKSFEQKELIPNGMGLLRFKEGASKGDNTIERLHKSVVFNTEKTAMRMLILEPVEEEPKVAMDIPF